MARLDTYTSFEADAETIEAGYRKALEELRKRDDLSPKGKADAQAQLEQQRHNKVERLQGVAALSLKLDKEYYVQKLKEAQTAEVARLRRVLGDATLTHIYERRLERMTPAQILDMHAAAVDEWQKTLLGELGAAVIEGRTTPATQDADRQAVAALRQTPQAVQQAEEALEELRHAEVMVTERLDVHAYHERLAVTMGVRADLMPLPNAPADTKPLDLPPTIRRSNMFGVAEEA